MTNITINEKNHTIEMNKKDFEAASRYGTEAYNDLQIVRRDYPGFRVVMKKASRKATDHNMGLTYKFMAKYIREHCAKIKTEEGEKESEQFETFEEMVDMGCSYDTIKNWFLSQFPEVKREVSPRVQKALDDAKAYAEENEQQKNEKQKSDRWAA